MIPHTRAFKRLKDEAQKVFDFALLVCYAVPNLKRTLDQLAPGQPISFTPDHFDTRPVATEKVRRNAKDYKELLSRYIFLSSFSFFEAYFLDVLSEVIEFHGRVNLLKRHDLSRNSALASSAQVKARKKLREYKVSANLGAYTSYGSQLAKDSFVFPSSALARHGLRRLFDTVDDEYIKAKDIPEWIESLFQLQLDQVNEKQVYHSYREMRNKIAHGHPDQTSLHLKKAIEANNFLRNLALKLDRHILEHYLLVEAF